MIAEYSCLLPETLQDNTVIIYAQSFLALALLLLPFTTILLV